MPTLEIKTHTRRIVQQQGWSDLAAMQKHYLSLGTEFNFLVTLVKLAVNIERLPGTICFYDFEFRSGMQMRFHGPFYP